MDGLYINLNLFGLKLNVNWDLWKDVYAYEAEEQGGLVFIREQRRKFLPKRRRVIHLAKGHDKHS